MVQAAKGGLSMPRSVIPIEPPLDEDAPEQPASQTASLGMMYEDAPLPATCPECGWQSSGGLVHSRHCPQYKEHQPVPRAAPPCHDCTAENTPVGGSPCNHCNGGSLFKPKPKAARTIEQFCPHGRPHWEDCPACNEQQPVQKPMESESNGL